MIRVSIDNEKVADFCRRRKVREFALFGSVLREDFRPDSDVDVLLTFEEGAGISFDNRVELEEEVSALFGRKVDLVEKKRIRNPFRRYAILTSKQVLYAA